MTIYLVDLEAVESRYTGQWKTYIPSLLKKHGHDVDVIEGPKDIPRAVTPGAFLNFGGTNIYKARQVEELAKLFTAGKIHAGDHIIFTDAWHPGIINLKYMSELLGIKVTTHGLWHAGSYDPQDFLGRLIGDEPWVRNAEFSFFYCFDHNYFATDFHIEMFCKNLLDDDDVESVKSWHPGRIVRTGWPMDYMPGLFTPYKGMTKRDLILFPHRIAPEKQVEIFRDIKEQLPQYEFVVCQDQELTKNEYHNLLGEAKMVFSANLQETLGISCYEGVLVDAIPMVPDRLSYSEMYFNNFKYPSEWTESFDSYIEYRPQVLDAIVEHMSSYSSQLPILHKQSIELTDKFFSADILLENLK